MTKVKTRAKPGPAGSAAVRLVVARQAQDPDPRTLLDDTVRRLQQDAVNLLNSSAAKLDAREREAYRYLYERLVNFKGMLYKRPLLRMVEFLTQLSADTVKAAPRAVGARLTPGWYYKSDRASPWIGPFASAAEAEEERSSGLPTSRLEFMMSKLEEME